MSFRIATFAALLVIAIEIRQIEAGYNRLNKYLIEKVHSDEAAPNMEAAIRWLQEQKDVKLPLFSTEPIRDLKKFTALQQVIEDTGCDMSSQKIIQQNEEAVGLYKLIEDRHVTRRVDKVMLSIFRAHARRCAQVHLAVYHKKIKQLDKSKYEKVDNLGQMVMNMDKFYSGTDGYYFYRNYALFDRYVEKIPKVQSFVRPGVFHTALESNAESDPDIKYTRRVPDEQTGRYVVHRDKLRELVREHLIEPCRYYVDELGPEIFIPERLKIPIQSKLLDGENGFYRDWSYFMICSAVVSDERAVHDYVFKSANEARITYR